MVGIMLVVGIICTKLDDDDKDNDSNKGRSLFIIIFGWDNRVILTTQGQNDRRGLLVLTTEDGMIVEGGRCHLP